MQPGVDLMYEDVTAPAMLNGRTAVPLAGRRILDAGQQGNEVSPGQMVNRLLTTCVLRVGTGEHAHVFQVGRRHAFQVRELCTEIPGGPGNDLGAPARIILAREDGLTDLPVEGEQFPVDGQGHPNLRPLDPGLEVGQEGRRGLGKAKHLRHGGQRPRSCKAASQSLLIAVSTAFRT